MTCFLFLSLSCVCACVPFTRLAVYTYIFLSHFSNSCSPVLLGNVRLSSTGKETASINRKSSARSEPAHRSVSSKALPKHPFIRSHVFLGKWTPTDSREKHTGCAMIHQSLQRMTRRCFSEEARYLPSGCHATLVTIVLEVQSHGDANDSVLTGAAYLCFFVRTCSQCPSVVFQKNSDPS